MSLLVDMMANTLDEAYVERAARRTEDALPARPEGPSPRGRAVVSVGVLVILGLLTGIAVAQVRGRQAESTGLRADLLSEVRDRTAQSEDLSGRAQALRDEVAAAREATLGADAAGRILATSLTALGLASATTPVQGPGVVVTLDDAPAEADAEVTALREGSVGDGRVADRDLQDAVNALWDAGAEAIAINDQRLTALTAKRSAGGAILVDLLPLSPPYVVEAIGDPAALELGLLDGPVGRRLATYTSVYGLRLELVRAKDLSLPGAAEPDLRIVVLTVPGGPS